MVKLSPVDAVVGEFIERGDEACDLFCTESRIIALLVSHFEVERGLVEVIALVGTGIVELLFVGVKIGLVGLVGVVTVVEGRGVVVVAVVVTMVGFVFAGRTNGVTVTPVVGFFLGIIATAELDRLLT